jgi:uncharacterized glyoxalase superfamily protein PhnB
MTDANTSTTSTSASTSASGAAVSTAGDPTKPKFVWPCLTYEDAPAAVRFLRDVLGFEETLVVTDDADAKVVHHAEMRWPEGGGVMFGSAGRDSEFSRNAGMGTVYVLTDRPDEIFARAQAGGARVVQEIKDEDYGSRGFIVADPEGNLWSFGTYRGA